MNTVKESEFFMTQAKEILKNFQTSSLSEKGAFFIQYKNLQNEILKTAGLQTTKLHNKNDNPGSKNP